MELLSDTLRKRRGRPRKMARDESAQTSPFPTVEMETPSEQKIGEDAAAKQKILDAAKQIPEIFTPDQVKWVFDAYVAILCFVYSIALKTEFKALQDELEFSEEQKDAMAKPLARICSKYAPASWAAMAPEIELVTMLGLFTVASFGRAKLVVEKVAEKKKDAERTQPVAPINRSRTEIHVPA